MIPFRPPPFAPPLPATSASEAGPSNSAADNPVPNIQPPPSVVATPRTRPPGWLAVPQAGDSTASAHKRQLPPPAVPSATRLRTDAGPLQAALAAATPSPATLQQQAQTTEALATWDQARQPYFYLEQQCGQAQACAQHAVNAMVDGPLVSLAHFAQWEADAQAQRGDVPDPVGSAPPDDAEDMIRELWDEPVSLVHDATPDLSQSEIDDLIRGLWDEPASPAHDAMPDLSQSEIGDLIQELWDEPASSVYDATPDLSQSEIDDLIREFPGEPASPAHDAMPDLRPQEKRRMSELIYDPDDASSHWRTRAAEFEPLWQEWNRETRRDENGPAFLWHLSILCKEAGEGKPVAEDARIGEFEVKTYPEAKETVRVWRMVYGDNRISLRLAPPEGDSKARTALLKSMRNSAAISVSHRRAGPTGELIYAPGDAYNHWKARAGEFEPLRQERNRKTERNEKGPTFLWYLSVLCKESGEGKPVTEDARIREFEVKTYPEAKEAVRLWRMVYGDNRIILRLAPPEGDSEARTALLKSMQKFANISDQRRKASRKQS